MRRTILIGLMAIFAISLFAGVDSLYFAVSANWGKATPDSGLIQIDSAGTIIDTVICDTTGHGGLKRFHPAIAYKFFCKFDPRDGWYNSDTLNFSYGADAGDSIGSANYSFSVEQHNVRAGIITMTNSADPAMTYIDSIIVAVTNSGNTDTLYFDTIPNANTGYVMIPSDSLTVGTTYRVYTQDAGGYYAARYWSAVYDTGRIFIAELHAEAVIPMDTLTINLISTATGKAPTSSKTLTATFEGLETSARQLADTSGSNYYFPTTDVRTVTSNQNGAIIFIAPTYTCWKLTGANIVLTSEFICLDSSYTTQAFTPKR